MSFKQALMQYKQQIEDSKIQEKIQKMLDEQKSLLKPTVKTLTSKTPYERKEFEEDVLVNGGVAIYKCILNGKERRVRVSVTSDNNDVVLKYHCLIASGQRFSCNVKGYNEARIVIDSIFGKGQYSPSASRV